MWRRFEIGCLQMHLSPDALTAHICFQSVFFVTHRVTHNDDMESRQTEGHQRAFLKSSM